MSDQVWTVAVSPAQRWVLMHLAHYQGQKVKGQQGRVFRRFMQAFGLDVIDETLRADDAVSPDLVNSFKKAAFSVTAENIEYARALFEVERLPRDETVIGPLFDALEEIETASAPDETIPRYDRASESWKPPVESSRDPVEIAVEKIVAVLKTAGHEDAAALVSAGGWDKPEVT